ncbi:N-acetyl-gamma-glutamyl-phosphate reductase, partial [Oleiphilus sp. HI0123]
KVEITVVTSRTEKGRPVADMFPHVRGYIDLPFTDPSVDELAGCDLIFFATPHGVAQSMMSEFIDSGLRTIDLSGDFRLKDVDVWESWYDQKHACPELIPQAAYGLPEIYREQIKDAKLVACPGCFPTVIQLGFLPLVEQGLVQADRLIADAKTGTSGAGRAAKVGMLLSECADSFKAYGVSGHRHLPEIQQILSEANGSPVNVTFVPHLVPMIRGIEATLYIQPKPDAELSLEQAQAIYEERYKDEPFVDVMPLGSLPETRSVKGSNMCRIALHQQPGSNTIIVLSVIDNLVKGSSGQAIQNMNLMFGFDEMMGLQQVALMP